MAKSNKKSKLNKKVKLIRKNQPKEKTEEKIHSLYCDCEACMKRYGPADL